MVVFGLGLWVGAALVYGLIVWFERDIGSYRGRGIVCAETTNRFPSGGRSDLIWIWVGVWVWGL